MWYTGRHADHLAGRGIDRRASHVSLKVPASTRTRASKGAVCSLSASPASKANSVTVPSGVLGQHAAGNATFCWRDECVERQRGSGGINPDRVVIVIPRPEACLIG